MLSSFLLAIAEFVANSSVSLNFLPRFRLKLGLGLRVGGEMVKTYSRKRKRIRLEEELQVLKNREISVEGDKMVELALPSVAYYPDASHGLSKSGISNTGYGDIKDRPLVASRGDVNYASITGCRFETLDCDRHILPSI